MNKTIIVFNERARFKAENEMLINNFEILNRILFDARNFYEIWFGYLRTKSKSKYFITFLKYKDFFETIGYSCITSLTIDLFKLYDSGQESYSILHLINDINERSLLSSTDKRNIRIKKKQAIIIWGKVKELRHKLFAHRDKNLTLKEIYAIANITPNDFRDLTQYTLEILNYIAPVLHKNKIRFRREVRNDAVNLLRILMEAQ